MNDLSWIDFEAFVLCINNIEHILVSEPDDYKLLIEILQSTVNEWIKGRNYGALVTPSTPYKIILHCEEENLSTTLEYLNNSNLNVTRLILNK
jgi:hypothetical protein